MSALWRPPAAVAQAVTGSVVFGDVVQVSHVDGDVTISTDRPPYQVAPMAVEAVPLSRQRAQAQPSRLLLARHQIVPFTGRDQVLADLADWVGDPEAMAVRLIHAAGGQGKTRLAGYVAARCAAEGWAVWQVVHTSTPVPGSRLNMPGGAVLAVVDYADRWPASHLLALLTQLHALSLRAGMVVRVLLLARSAGFWRPALGGRLDRTLAVPADDMALSSLSDHTDRSVLFATAARSFAGALDVAHADWLAPHTLNGPGYAQVLAVHMAALAVVDAHRHGAAPPAQPHAVSAYLLRREYAHWQHLHARTESPLHTPPAVMRRTAYVATLTGALPRPTARAVLTQVELASGVPDADQIIDDHRTCQPAADSGTVLEALHPDSLGEDLIALSTPGHPHTGGDTAHLVDDWTLTALPALLTSPDSEPPAYWELPAWTAAAVTVLVETAHRWPHIATNVLYPLLATRPELALAAGGATLTRLAELPNIDIDILEAIDSRMPVPMDRDIDLDNAAAAINTLVTRHRLTTTSDPNERARLVGRHSWRVDKRVRPHATYAWLLATCGRRLLELVRRGEGLDPTGEATDIYRVLAETNAGVYLVDFDGSLNKLGMGLSKLVRRREVRVRPRKPWRSAKCLPRSTRVPTRLTSTGR